MSDHDQDRRSAYLWDRTGAPDPDVERLENMLGGYRYRRPARRRRFLVAAAVLLAASIALSFALDPNPGEPEPAPASWAVTWQDGGGADRLQVGEWLETDRESRARV